LEVIIPPLLVMSTGANDLFKAASTVFSEPLEPYKRDILMVAAKQDALSTDEYLLIPKPSGLS